MQKASASGEEECGWVREGGGGGSLRDMRYSAMGIKAMTRNIYSMALTIVIV